MLYLDHMKTFTFSLLLAGIFLWGLCVFNFFGFGGFFCWLIVFFPTPQNFSCTYATKRRKYSELSYIHWQVEINIDEIKNNGHS